MLWAVRQLLKPAQYLAIKQGVGVFASKRTYDLWLPLALTVTTTTLLYFLNLPVGFFADTGIVTGVIDLLNLIIAFFIAALAAVATFDRTGLDKPLKGNPAFLKILESDGIVRERPLTNRQFICYLFGYLSFVSLTLLIVIHFARLFGPRVIYTLQLGEWMLWAIHWLASVLFFFVLWQILVTMFLGLYFLSDRIPFIDDERT